MLDKLELAAAAAAAYTYPVGHSRQWGVSAKDGRWLSGRIALKNPEAISPGFG